MKEDTGRGGGGRAKDEPMTKLKKREKKRQSLERLLAAERKFFKDRMGSGGASTRRVAPGLAANARGHVRGAFYTSDAAQAQSLCDRHIGAVAPALRDPIGSIADFVLGSRLQLFVANKLGDLDVFLKKRKCPFEVARLEGLVPCWTARAVWHKPSSTPACPRVSSTKHARAHLSQICSAASQRRPADNAFSTLAYTYARPTALVTTCNGELFVTGARV